MILTNSPRIQCVFVLSSFVTLVCLMYAPEQDKTYKWCLYYVVTVIMYQFAMSRTKHGKQ